MGTHHLRRRETGSHRHRGEETIYRLIRSLSGAFGRVPLAARFAGAFLGDPLRLLGRGPFERQQLVYDLPFRRLALLNDGPTVETVMLDRDGQFPKSTVAQALLRPLIGDGVFGQPGGDTVRDTRRILARSLAAIGSDRIAEVTRDLTTAQIGRWLERRSGPLPIGVELSRLTVDIVSECVLGSRFDERQSRRFTELFSQYHAKARPLVLMLASDQAGRRTRIIREMGLEAIGREMRDMIRSRFIEGAIGRATAAGSFNRLMEEATAGAPDAAERLLDETAVLLLAGHETTASTLSWLAYELARRPDLQEAAAAALDGAGEDATIDALTNETLRLYPPIGFFLRENTRPLELRDTTLPVDSFVVVSPRSLHRHRDIWDDPDAFKPERWLYDGSTPPRTAFMPFGMGARVCPGARFASVELREIVRLMLRHLRLSPAGGKTPRPLGNLTSRPEPDIVLNVAARLPLPVVSANAKGGEPT